MLPCLYRPTWPRLELALAKADAEAAAVRERLADAASHRLQRSVHRSGNPVLEFASSRLSYALQGVRAGSFLGAWIQAPEMMVSFANQLSSSHTAATASSLWISRCGIAGWRRR